MCQSHTVRCPLPITEEGLQKRKAHFHGQFKHYVKTTLTFFLCSAYFLTVSALSLGNVSDLVEWKTKCQLNVCKSVWRRDQNNIH